MDEEGQPDRSAEDTAERGADLDHVVAVVVHDDRDALVSIGTVIEGGAIRVVLDGESLVVVVHPVDLITGPRDVVGAGYGAKYSSEDADEASCDDDAGLVEG